MDYSLTNFLLDRDLYEPLQVLPLDAPHRMALTAVHGPDPGLAWLRRL